jgi:hypothetical protein
LKKGLAKAENLFELGLSQGRSMTAFFNQGLAEANNEIELGLSQD